MTNVTLKVTGASAVAICDGLLTARAVGIPIDFQMLDSAWDGLAVMLKARAGDKIIIIADLEHPVIPWECMEEGARLYLGAEGWNADGTLRIPTIWASVGVVRPSAHDEATPPEPDPTPSQVEQITTLAQNAERKAQSVVDAAERGDFNGAPGQDYDHSEEYAALHKQMAEYQKQVDEDRQSIDESVGIAETHATNAKESEENAEIALEQAKQIASKNGYFWFEVDDDGHLIETRTDNVAEDLRFEITNGRMEVTFL